MPGQGALSRNRCGQRILGPRKGDENGIPLSVHNLTTMLLKNPLEEGVLVDQDIGVPIPQIVQKTRRALYVGEEERNSSRWQRRRHELETPEPHELETLAVEDFAHPYGDSYRVPEAKE